ncbi:hypothetical protein RYX56_00620 [Alkalihalophilus lindianensis]|uniref:Lipoprotein n=1 Tax=Alkalihalophilus lindianensis TaxID=1630542 RepID=A0ABU3X4P9_9BACI|nr:hypothetical protein [Alkalihalophilus lindianensis]MDV2682867.1 hypothetical protein [Alkalihalophilus lindianensis]
MSKKLVMVIGSLMLLFLGGCSLYQNVIGNTDLMTSYLEDTESITDGYLMLLNEEATIEDEEELTNFTEDRVIPTLNQLLADSNEVEANYSDEQLLEVHALLPQSFELLVEANEKWLEGNDEAEDLFMQSEELYLQYENDLEKLASKWGIEIVWEDIEE